jgi:hypothetical protein
MNTSVTFTSDRFIPYLPDDAQVNPGRYGFELAAWISRELAKKGVMTSYPNYEDWGWFIEYASEAGEEFWLCCGNVEGAQNEWHCFLDPKSKGLFARKPNLAGAMPLLVALKETLDNAAYLTDVNWSEE